MFASSFLYEVQANIQTCKHTVCKIFFFQNEKRKELPENKAIVMIMVVTNEIKRYKLVIVGDFELIYPSL